MRMQHIRQAGVICALALYFAFLVAAGRPASAAPNCYGPVQQTDTLWEIARRLSPDISVSPQRMMIALLRANPRAFFSDNVNALNAGSTLCFDLADAEATDDRTAVALVSRYNQEWRSGNRVAADRAFRDLPSTSSDRELDPSKALQDASEVAEDGTPLPLEAGPGDLAPETEPSESPPPSSGASHSSNTDHETRPPEAWYDEVDRRLEAAEAGIERLRPDKPDADALDELASIRSRLNRIEDKMRELSDLYATAPEARTIPQTVPGHDQVFPELSQRVTLIEAQMRSLVALLEAENDVIEAAKTRLGRSLRSMTSVPLPSDVLPESPAVEPAPEGRKPSAGRVSGTDDSRDAGIAGPPRGEPATELMPTPAPQGEPAMELMPTPAPQGEPAMEPMPTPAPQGEPAMEPMPTPAPQGEPAMEPMPTPAPQGEPAMEPMPTPAPQGEPAMEPMPTPAPQGEPAMEPMPTPAPQGEPAMEPMPTPAPLGEPAMEPMPTPAPQGEPAMEPMPTPAPLGEPAMEPMPTPAPQGEPAMEPMPTPAPQGEPAMEPMPTPAPQGEPAMEPMPTPAPRGEPAMEPMPTPAPQGEPAMEPMPTPAPQGEPAMEPMPTPAPQGEPAMEPMPTPAPQGEPAMEPMPTPAPQGEPAMEPMPTPAPQGEPAMEPMPTPGAAGRTHHGADADAGPAG